MVARPTPDRKVASSNLAGIMYSFCFACVEHRRGGAAQVPRERNKFQVIRRSNQKSTGQTFFVHNDVEHLLTTRRRPSIASAFARHLAGIISFWPSCWDHDHTTFLLFAAPCLWCKFVDNRRSNEKVIGVAPEESHDLPMSSECSTSTTTHSDAACVLNR